MFNLKMTMCDVWLQNEMEQLFIESMRISMVILQKMNLYCYSSKFKKIYTYITTNEMIIKVTSLNELLTLNINLKKKTEISKLSDFARLCATWLVKYAHTNTQSVHIHGSSCGL